MEQKFKTKQEEKRSDIQESLKRDFESLVSQEVTREVILIYQSCCGCGCSDINVRRTVPANSNLQSGDRIGSLQSGDKEI